MDISINYFAINSFDINPKNMYQCLQCLKNIKNKTKQNPRLQQGRRISVLLELPCQGDRNLRLFGN